MEQGCTDVLTRHPVTTDHGHTGRRNTVVDSDGKGPYWPPTVPPLRDCRAATRTSYCSSVMNAMSVHP